MDYKFLDKVLGQIVSETKIDYRGRGKIFTPFNPFHLSPTHFSSHFSFYRSLFTKHCKEVYGLNEDEVRYVWGEYKNIITEKLNNGL